MIGNNLPNRMIKKLWEKKSTENKGWIRYDNG